VAFGESARDPKHHPLHDAKAPPFDFRWHMKAQSS
jgi:hypothetical protein